MKIIGYSERGAMNALFYGIALKEDKQSMNKFLKAAGIEEEYIDYTVYSEFSLSDFGDPDMVIIADKENGKKDVIFIEAKVSVGKKFILSEQYKNHNEYVNQDEYQSGQSSNLFFQLRQKYYFFETKGKVDEQKDFEIQSLIKYYDQKQTGVRRIGNNEVVLKFMDEIKECDFAHYIAIIPKSEESYDYKNEYGFDIHFIYWEDLVKIFEKYLSITIDYNQTDNYNQILNRYEKNL